MARCLICHSVWGIDPHDPFWTCDRCLATKPVEVSEAWEKLYERADHIWSNTAYRKDLSSEKQFITQTGSIAWTWVILRANDEDMTPVHIPIWITPEKQRICRRASIAGPFPYSHSRLIQAMLNRDNPEYSGRYEIYDESGFLVTSQNVGKYTLSVQDATNLIHWGRIKYVMHWAKPNKKYRKWYFPRQESLVTSFVGEESGLKLIRDLLINGVIVWNSTYEVYTTMHFNPKQPPSERYRSDGED